MFQYRLDAAWGNPGAIETEMDALRAIIERQDYTIKLLDKIASYLAPKNPVGPKL